MNNFPVFQENPPQAPPAIWASLRGPFWELCQWFLSSGCGYALKWMVVKVRGSAVSDRHRGSEDQSQQGTETLPALPNRFPGASEICVMHSFWGGAWNSRAVIPQNFWSVYPCPTRRSCKALENVYRTHIKCKEMMQKDICSSPFRTLKTSAHSLRGGEKGAIGLVQPSAIHSCDGTNANIFDTHETKHCKRWAPRMLKRVVESIPVATATEIRIGRGSPAQVMLRVRGQAYPHPMPWLKARVLTVISGNKPEECSRAPHCVRFAVSVECYKPPS